MITISKDRYAEISASEEWILTLTSSGLAKDHLRLNLEFLVEADKVLQR